MVRFGPFPSITLAKIKGLMVQIENHFPEAQITEREMFASPECEGGSRAMLYVYAQVGEEPLEEYKEKYEYTQYSTPVSH